MGMGNGTGAAEKMHAGGRGATRQGGKRAIRGGAWGALCGAAVATGLITHRSSCGPQIS